MNQNEELQELQQQSHEEHEPEIYGDDYLVSNDAKVPRVLLILYVVLAVWGFFALFYYINGSRGWLDRGYWNQLQRAALTTFPYGTIEGEGERKAETD